jgi:hypothetical protein
MMNRFLSAERPQNCSTSEIKVHSPAGSRKNIYRVVSLLLGAVKRLQHINKMSNKDMVWAPINVFQTSLLDAFNSQVSKNRESDWLFSRNWRNGRLDD